MHDFEVLAQFRNDPEDPSGSGFSGTLFRNRSTGELTLSFRSTEFIEDAVRDSKSTNELEVKELGWALGQISAMESWYRELRDDPALLQGRAFHVTGYSLGGHLATAFNILRREEAVATASVNPIIDTHTFNGAGVGGLRAGATLTGIVAEFDRLRSLPDIQASADWSALSIAQRTVLRNDATSRLADIDREARRIQGLSAPFAFAQRPPAGEQATLNYQLAALLAARDAIPVSRAPFAFRGVNWIPTDPVFAPDSERIASMIEIVGSDAGRLGPSFVANSGIHYGTRQQVYIEDQPLTRGTYILVAKQASLAADPSQNDFADTHSLVLLVDSLALLAAFERLDASFSLEDGRRILAAASSARAESLFLTQGRAEGDTLERTLDALATLVFGPGQAPTLPDYAATLAGNTWHEQAFREPFHERLKALDVRIGELAADPGFAPRVVSLSGMTSEQIAILAGDAGADGTAYRYALRELNPFAILGFGYDLHNAHGELDLDDGMGSGDVTEQWLEARADMLAARLRYNTLDGGTLANVNQRYEDARLGVNLGPNLPGIERAIFGGDAADSIAGSFSNDRLFGGGGADVLTGGLGDDYLEGGAGFDTYVYASGDGRDSVVDSDGQGMVTYKGRTLAGGDQVAPNVYEDAEGTRYTLLDAAGAEKTLLIDGNLEIESFASGELGIVLHGSSDPPAPPANIADRVYADDAYPVGGDPGLDGRKYGAAHQGGSDQNDLVTTSGGSGFATRGGDDTILLAGTGNLGADAGAGDDLIDATGVAGPSSLRLVGGAGADYILGSGFADEIYGDNARVLIGVQPFAAQIDAFSFDVSASVRNQPGMDPAYVALLEHAGSYAGLQVLSWPFHDYTPLIVAEGWNFPGGLPDALQYVQGTDPVFDDYIDGGAGPDLIYAGNGSDVVHGGAGDDRISGDYDDMTLVYGDASAAFGERVSLFGQPGDDYLDGGDGNDTIHDTLGGNDTLIGGAGDDSLFATSAEGGFDILLGGEGNDQLDTLDSPGFTYLDGGTGDDTYAVRAGIVRDEGGLDSLTSNFDGVVLMQTPVSSIEEAMFGSGLSTGLFGVEVARSGDDLVCSYTFPVFELAPEVEEATSREDLIITMHVEQLAFSDWYRDPAYHIEHINAFTDEQFENWGSYQVGAFDAATFLGGANTDRIAGSIGNDRVIASAGNDLIAGREGDDLLDGGAGDDTFYYAAGHGNDIVLDSGGTDVLRLAPGISRGDVSLAYENSSLVVRVAGGSVTLAGIGPGDIAGDLPIDTIAFADRSSVGVGALAALIPPPPEPPLTEGPPAVIPTESTAGYAAPLDAGSPSAAVVPPPAPAAPPSGQGGATADSSTAPALADPGRGLFLSEETSNPAAEETLASIGISFDPVYRDIDARLDVLLQAGRANLGERYAQAIEEFERRRTGNEESIALPPSNEEIGRWNEAVHDWHARHPGFESGPVDGTDGVWATGWNGLASGGHSLADLLGAAGDTPVVNPHALGKLSGVRPAPGLGEGIAELRG